MSLKEISTYVRQPAVMERIKELTPDADKYVASALMSINNDYLLKVATPQSIYGAIMASALIKLPISSAGYAYIVPFDGKAQFLVSARGFAQLCIRSGMYERINAIPVRDGQLVKSDPVNGYVFDWDANPDGEIVGYYAFLKQKDGFFAEIYDTKQNITKHAQKYSKSFASKSSAWGTAFDEMACKTVLKRLISRWGLMSGALEDAIRFDQATIKDVDGVIEPDYIDNPQSTDSLTEEDILDGL